MGKYILLVTLGVVAAVSVLSLQGQKTSKDTSERQGLRNGKVLARQVARSGYNAVLSKARIAEQEHQEVGDIIEAVGSVAGSYEGGTYEAHLEKASSNSYRPIAIGHFPVQDTVMKHRIGRGNKMVEAPTIEEPSTLNVTFNQSQAGYCSAIYLKRILPDTEPEDQPDPELIFPPGNDRNGMSTSYDKTIQAGTKLNFILAVDADYNCEERGNSIGIGHEMYNYKRTSFEQKTGQIDGVEESPYGMVEETTVDSKKGWRVSFEDRHIFSEDQLWDIKKNGYPDTDYGDPSQKDWDPVEETYGGDGWEKEGNLHELEDFGDIPDFSDQVIEVATTNPA